MGMEHKDGLTVVSPEHHQVAVFKAVNSQGVGGV